MYYKVVLRTTKYYSLCTKKYYTVLLCTTKCFSVLHSTSPRHMKRPVQCAEQQDSSANFTKYCACHEKWLWWLILISNETSSTMRGASRVTLQLDQIVRLPGKTNLMIDPPHIWNVQYNARSNRTHPPSSPNTAPATKNDSDDWSLSQMKRPVQCAEQQESPSNFTKNCSCHEILSSRFQRKISELLPPIKKRFEDNSRIIGAWSDDKIVISHPPLRRAYLSHLVDAFSTEKYNISRSGYLPKFQEVVCLPGEVTVQLHQVLRLPRKMNFMIAPRHIWNVQWFIPWLNCCLAEVILDRNIPWPN